MHEMTWRDDGIVKDFNTFTPSQTPEPNINTSQNCRFFAKVVNNTFSSPLDCQNQIMREGQNHTISSPV